ncbi:preprotein translocase subunit SecA [Actinophytocola algeriensis]|uniref:Protein translocase subunit SecA n=1 Tax=Actinophytocola algeriensis TaxID=1768010 RepID=A0A7W7PZ21_9PSEU|nr:preprotein translocase subunit SecA [Actinophytocola algeriensis]MBB4903954.1 preprotein translocase subunit SecA [Actinophytocola algeriensis]MBE1477189.1 preprotein translocase subunit SecA [Actinophytocola algeriensis]
MVLSRILRAGEGKTLKHLKRIVEEVNGLEDTVLDLTDAQLRAKTDEFRKRYEESRDPDLPDGETDEDALGDLLPEAFAVIREAAKRVLGQRPFDVQIMGGAALHLGKVSEMRTGEGKTLTAVLPSYLNAISGNGVHLVTVNDYLAKRDAEWMGRVHRFLGLEVGAILSEMTPQQRRSAYRADVTYGTNNEFGFDYLRDNMAWSLDDMVQRGHSFAIVDEVDSILIDEARTPLIISGPTDQNSRWYQEFARMVPNMKKDVHYEVDERKRTVGVTEPGVAYIEDQLGIENLYEAANTPLVGYLNNALKAKELFKLDKDYIVRNGEVLIVDEFTGRILAGRRYNEGMHQAIEAKEKVEIKAENQTLATITLQNYFRLYHKLSGMTGTAETEAAEFQGTYKLGVVPIPTNRPMVRMDRSDLIYKTEEAKFEAVADDIAERHEKGQPVLIGTTSVERSEYLSKLLVKRRIPHNVLNAKHHEKESAIVAEAGHRGAVTVATNMAGRGTDIVLGGNPDHLAEEALRARGLDPLETPDEWKAALPGALEKARAEVHAEAEEVREAGGLYVLGTERHESRRIDNQLRGRSGRQGDPGESRFYLSLGDELMRRFNAAFVERVMVTMRVPDDQPIEAKMVTRAIKSAQTQVEQQNFEIRKDVLKYDEVMNRQRKVIYGERSRVLKGEDLHDQVENMIVDVVTDYVRAETGGGYAEDWDHEKLWTALKTLYPISLKFDDLVEEAEAEGKDLTSEFLEEAIVADAKRAYRDREADIDAKAGPDAMRRLERQVMLSVLDRKWREHLYEMDYLKQGIGLRAMAQRDPLIEYQREGFDMFATMLEALKEECVGYLFNLQVEQPEPEPSDAASLPSAADRVVRAQRAVAAAQAAQQAQAERVAAAEEKIPPALRGKGLGAPPGGPQKLTYSGPAEGGGVESRSNSSNNGRDGGSADGSGGSGTRRERRAAERAAQKKGKKGPRR